MLGEEEDDDDDIDIDIAIDYGNIDNDNIDSSDNNPDDDFNRFLQSVQDKNEKRINNPDFVSQDSENVEAGPGFHSNEFETDENNIAEVLKDIINTVEKDDTSNNDDTLDNEIKQHNAIKSKEEEEDFDDHLSNDVNPE